MTQFVINWNYTLSTESRAISGSLFGQDISDPWPKQTTPPVGNSCGVRLRASCDPLSLGYCTSAEDAAGGEHYGRFVSFCVGGFERKIIKRERECVCVRAAHAVHKTHKLHCIFHPVQSTGTVNYLTLASFQTRRPRWGATITLGLSIPLSPSFYFNESTINKEMDQLPKGGWFLYNGSLLLSMAVLNSSTRPLGYTEGHL